jgi:hypothetical protein
MTKEKNKKEEEEEGNEYDMRMRACISILSIENLCVQKNNCFQLIIKNLFFFKLLRLNQYFILILKFQL